jgi:hypothetical protein
MMKDIFYLGVAVVFSMLTWGLLKVCDLLDNQSPGDKQ